MNADRMPEGPMPVETWTNCMGKWLDQFAKRMNEEIGEQEELTEAEWYEQWEAFIWNLVG